MFGDLKLGLRIYGIWRDVKRSLRARELMAKKDNLWKHKTTWAALALIVGVVGKIATGEQSFTEAIMSIDTETLTLLGVAVFSLFKADRDVKAKNEANGT